MSKVYINRLQRTVISSLCVQFRYIYLIFMYFRSYLEMKAEQTRFNEMRESVLTIQRTWRGFLCRQKYAQDIKNIVSVQNQVFKTFL